MDVSYGDCFLSLFVIVSAVLITYQDFRDRLISLWAIILFAGLIVLHHLRQTSFNQVYENFLFAMFYITALFLMLFIYYFIKERQFGKILNNKIGLADILIMVILGVTMEAVMQIYFFMAAFFLGLVLHLLFSSRRKSVPLAGYMLIFYLPFFIYRFLGSALQF